jgi:hypothetical protein
VKALSPGTGAQPSDDGQSRRAELRPLTDRADFAGSAAVVTVAVQACGSMVEAGVAAMCRKRAHELRSVSRYPISACRLESGRYG